METNWRNEIRSSQRMIEKYEKEIEEYEKLLKSAPRNKRAGYGSQLARAIRDANRWRDNLAYQKEQIGK